MSILEIIWSVLIIMAFKIFIPLGPGDFFSFSVLEPTLRVFYYCKYYLRFIFNINISNVKYDNKYY